MPRKPSFCWPKLVHDIAFLKEVVAEWPMKAETWDSVAETLSDLFGVIVGGQACWEHLDLLVKKFKADEQKVLKRQVFVASEHLILMQWFFIVLITMSFDAKPVF